MVEKCEKCSREFGSKEALYMHSQSKHPQEEVKKPFLTIKQKKRIKMWTISLVVIIGIVWLVSFFAANVKTLPPKDMQGHMEVSPPSHILKEPMGITVHKHMLEHADGKEGGRGGIIINYNCEDFNCKESLVEKLEAFAIKYPAHVYVAPYRNMDAMIVLTKLNQQKVLEEYNEKIIEGFVQ